MNLVDQHEALTQKQSLKCQDVMLLTSELNQLKMELGEKKNLLQEYKDRLAKKDEENYKLIKNTEARTREHLENERNFAVGLKQKEEAMKEM